MAKKKKKKKCSRGNLWNKVFYDQFTFKVNFPWKSKCIYITTENIPQDEQKQPPEMFCEKRCF